MASSSVRENVFLTMTPTLGGVYGKLLYTILNFFILGQMIVDDIFWVLSTFVMVIDVCHHYQRRLADVIALINNGWFYCRSFYWLMLLPMFLFVADVIATVFYGWCCCHSGWCYCHLCKWADVIALCYWLMLLPMFLFVADVITTVFLWLMLLPWWLMVLPLVWADVFAPLIIDGTAKCDSYDWLW